MNVDYSKTNQKQTADTDVFLSLCLFTECVCMCTSILGYWLSTTTHSCCTCSHARMMHVSIFWVLYYAGYWRALIVCLCICKVKLFRINSRINRNLSAAAERGTLWWTQGDTSQKSPIHSVLSWIMVKIKWHNNLSIFAVVCLQTHHLSRNYWCYSTLQRDRGCKIYSRWSVAVKAHLEYLEGVTYSK